MDSEQRFLADWRNQQDSTLFRRGMNMASSSENFRDIVESLIQVTEKRNKIDILAVGVAFGEEPLSVLSVIDSLAKIYNKPLEEMADLYVVDRRDPLDTDQINKRVYKHVIKGVLPGNNLVLNALEDDDDPMQFRVKSNIVDFFAKKIKDSSHGYWNTKIQDYLKKVGDRKYDFILYNNVDGHIMGAKDRDSTIRGLVKSLKVGGMLVTDYMYGGSRRLAALPDHSGLVANLGLKETRPGIFKRTK